MAEETNPPAGGATPEPAKTSSAAPAKKSNTTLIVIIVVILVFLVGAGILGNWLLKRASQKVASGILSSATGGSVNVSDNGVTLKGDNGSSIQAGDSTTWPLDMPSDVPKYSKGKITAAIKLNETSTGKSWSVTISETSQADYDAYLAQLAAAGWAKDTTVDFGASMSIFSKGTYSLSTTYDASSKGVQITVTPKS